VGYQARAVASRNVTTVLVATDSERVWDLVDGALASDDTSVYRVRAGRDVAVACRRVKPDVVVLDLQIGNSGGVATSLWLRQEQEMDRLDEFPILLLVDREADVFTAQISRADGWLVKPIDSLRLKRSIRAALSGDAVREGEVARQA